MSERYPLWIGRLFLIVLFAWFGIQMATEYNIWLGLLIFALCTSFSLWLYELKNKEAGRKKKKE